MRAEPRVSPAAERAADDDAQVAALAEWAATHPPRRRYTLTAVAGLLVMLAGAVLTALVTVPLNGLHLLAVLLTGGGGAVATLAVCKGTR